MSDRTDPAWDEYLSTGEDPTGGALEEADEETVSDEVVPGEWQQYAHQKKERVMTEAQKQRNYERIRQNRERKKWERENPKMAGIMALVKVLFELFALIAIAWLLFRSCARLLM